MRMQQFLSSARRALTVLPMMFALLTGATLLVTTTSATAQVAKSTPTKSIVDFFISGTVAGAPEDVVFRSVKVEIGSTLIPSGYPGVAPRLIVDIKFLDRPVGTGVTTHGVYFAMFQTSILREFAPNMTLAIPFPFLLNKAPFYEALSGLATYHLTFDRNGVITGAFGAISAIPNYDPPI